MSAAWAIILIWLPRTAIGGGVLLLLTWLLASRTRQPVRQQRLAECGLGASLLLAILCLVPPWTMLTVPWLSSTITSFEPTTQFARMTDPFSASIDRLDRIESQATESSPPLGDSPGLSGDSLSFVPGTEPSDFKPDAPDSAETTTPSREHSAGVKSAASEEAPNSTTYEASHTTPFWLCWRWPTWHEFASGLALAYALGALFLLCRWVLGQCFLWRLAWQARPAPAWIQEMLGKEPGVNRCRPRLLVSSSVRLPLSFGLLRPSIVLPSSMTATGPSSVLRWVLSHELTHLERLDAWGCLLFNLGQVVYYYLPWFWRLRRQAGLCQEYLADASAAETTAKVDYAQFLLSLTRAPAVPSCATGVSGHSSDLFRRITMLLRSPMSLDRRCPRLWSVGAACGLLSLGILLAGIGLRADAASKPDVDPPKQAEPPVAVPDLDLDLDDLPPEALKVVEEARARALAQQQEVFKRLRDVQAAAAQRPDYPGFPMMSGRKMENGRLGVRVDKPNSTLVEQLDLAKGKGLVIEQVLPDTAASKAGLKPHDILLEVDGKSVTDNPTELFKMIADIKTETKFDAVVLRKGKKETIKGLFLPEAKAPNPGNPFGGQPGFPPINVPRIDFQPFQGFPGGNGFAGAQGGLPMLNMPGFTGVMTTTFRTDDRFTTRHQEGSLIITVTGKVADGKAKTSEINVQDGKDTNKYESVDKVPEQYRDKVKNLIEMSEKGSVKIEIKKP